MQNPLRSWLLLILIGIIWGSSFILMKKGLIVFSAPQMASLRLSLAWLITFPFLFLKFRMITKKEWLILLVVGLLGNGIPAFLFAFAQTRIASSLAGMLNSLVPLLTMVFGLLFFGLRTWRTQVFGLLIGLLGAILLIVMPDGLDDFRPEALLVVLASTCYALNLNIVKKHLQNMHSMLITAGSFLWLGPFSMLYLFSTDFVARFDHPLALQSFLAVLVLSLVGTTLALLLFIRLIQSGGSLFASMVTYVVPIMAVVWGIVDGETVSPWSILGVIIILAGVYLVNKPAR